MVVVDNGTQRNRWAERTHGYLGLDPVAPRDLLRAAHEGLAAYPLVETVSARATAARQHEGRFVVDTSAGTFSAHRLILVPGLQLVQVATATGTRAGVYCAQSLRGQRGSSRSSQPAPQAG